MNAIQNIEDPNHDVMEVTRHKFHFQLLCLPGFWSLTNTKLNDWTAWTVWWTVSSRSKSQHLHIAGKTHYILYSSPAKTGMNRTLNQIKGILTSALLIYQCSGRSVPDRLFPCKRVPSLSIDIRSSVVDGHISHQWCKSSKQTTKNAWNPTFLSTDSPLLFLLFRLFSFPKIWKVTRRTVMIWFAWFRIDALWTPTSTLQRPPLCTE